MSNQDKGFGSMSEQQVKDIASQGGKASHGSGSHTDQHQSDGKSEQNSTGQNQGVGQKNDQDNNHQSSDEKKDQSSGKQGFGSMSKEEVQQHGHEGGKASHK